MILGNAGAHGRSETKLGYGSAALQNHHTQPKRSAQTNGPQTRPQCPLDAGRLRVGHGRRLRPAIAEATERYIRHVAAGRRHTDDEAAFVCWLVGEQHLCESGSSRRIFSYRWGVRSVVQGHPLRVQIGVSAVVAQDGDVLHVERPQLAQRAQ